ncbi:MAG: ribonuclease P protein component [Flavobacteriaceae bacterium]
MSFKFNKKEKLKSKKTIERLFREGKAITHHPLKMYYLSIDDGQECRFKTAVSVPKKNFKSAVHRNRIKRLMRESYRLNKHLIFNNIEGNFAFLILYLGKEMPLYREIEDSLQGVFQKLVNKKR